MILAPAAAGTPFKKSSNVGGLATRGIITDLDDVEAGIGASAGYSRESGIRYRLPGRRIRVVGIGGRLVRFPLAGGRIRRAQDEQ